MRVLLHADDPSQVGREVSEADLPALYAPLVPDWLRVNMVSTLDGGATGADGRSGTINNDADHAVFAALRRAADAVLVGAGTARAEGYSPSDVPIVLVSGSGEVPVGLRGAPAGRVLLATTPGSPGLGAARDQLGEDQVLVVGDDHVDLVALRSVLADRGWRHVLSEGGPSLLGALLAAGVVDELCLTVVPRVLAGDHRRIVSGPDLDVALRPLLLVEHDGTLLGRWRVAG